MKAAIVVVVLAAALAILRPWTMVPIHTTTARTFDAGGYVASIWDARVLPAAERSAVTLQALVEGQVSATARALFVKGTARVADVDRASRVGLARLAPPGPAGRRQVALQIGPVIRGTAVRDALDFIRFTDFVNQLEFAAVAGALNDRVLTTVLAPAAGLAAGAEITFVGAVAVSASSDVFEVVPVSMRIGGGAK